VVPIDGDLLLTQDFATAARTPKDTERGTDMAAVTHGMNVEEVKNLGHTLQTQADNIRNLVGQLDGLVNGTTWMGPDADQFKGQWWPEHKQHLLAVSEQLHGFGQSALNNASDQVGTSGH
jgi:hypothetical protein